MKNTIKLFLSILIACNLLYACSKSDKKQSDSKAVNKSISEKELLSSSLLRASAKGDLAKVKQALSLNADVNYKEKHKTPLLAATVNGHSEIAKLLIAKGADLNFKDIAGDTAYSQACTYGRLEIVKALLDAGFKEDHNSYFKADYKTAGFILASAYNRVNVAEYLKDRFKLDINSVDDIGETALIKASKAGSLEAVQFLLKNKAKVNQKSKNNLTALMGAAIYGRDAVVKLLLKAGANKNLKNKESKTAYQFALKAREGNPAKTAALLK